MNRKIRKSSITGQFVSKNEVKKHPESTYVQALGNFSIPELAKMLADAKSAKAKTVVPKFKIGQLVHRSGYSNYSGEILEIEIEIQDDGEPWITYTIDEVGTAWESELELSK